MEGLREQLSSNEWSVKPLFIIWLRTFLKQNLEEALLQIWCSQRKYIDNPTKVHNGKEGMLEGRLNFRIKPEWYEWPFYSDVKDSFTLEWWSLIPGS